MPKRITFCKYQGTGNDFVMLNNLDGGYDDLTLENIRFLCDRKMGIGADGLILLSAKEGFDFEVDYYNSDGSKSFCGNGARCSVEFAREAGVIQDKATFWAIDGKHKAFIKDGMVELEMMPVRFFTRDGEAYVMDTGSPHFVSLTHDLDKTDIVSFGKDIRYGEQYAKEGINVNQMQVIALNAISVRTYERGVEDETLSCGTGVTACALTYKLMNNIGDGSVSVRTRGGELIVRSGEYNEARGFEDIWLCGPAKKVFDGSIEL